MAPQEARPLDCCPPLSLSLSLSLGLSFELSHHPSRGSRGRRGRGGHAPRRWVGGAIAERQAGQHVKLHAVHCPRGPTRSMINRKAQPQYMIRPLGVSGELQNNVLQYLKLTDVDCQSCTRAVHGETWQHGRSLPVELRSHNHVCVEREQQGHVSCLGRKGPTRMDRVGERWLDAMGVICVDLKGFERQ